MLMAAMRLNIPAIFVSGGPMEAGVVGSRHYDLIDAMVMAADPAVTDEEIADLEKAACPTCGSCSGMFTANSMNCLTEALGLALAGQRHHSGDPQEPDEPVREGREAYRGDGSGSV